MFWFGVVIFSSYSFSLLLETLTQPIIALHLLPLVGAPIIMVFFLVGYLRPERGRIKVNMLAMSVVVGILYTIYVTILMSDLGGDLYLATWGMGGSIFISGGISIFPSRDESVTPGIMDVSALHYGPEPEPETETEPDAAAEPAVEAETPSETTVAGESPVEPAEEEMADKDE
jgi:hypothetical protein